MAVIEEISDAFYSYSFKQFEDELKDSDKPSEKNFPTKSEFSENFQNKINAVYSDLNRNYPPEQANYIYKTFIANLNKQSQNPGQSRIVNASKGTINIENLRSYSKKVQETLKARHPEKFENVNDKEVKVQSENNKVVDFSNPEEKKAYFDDGYNRFAKCKTREERIGVIQDMYGISFEEMSDEQIDEIISKVETRDKIRQIKESLDIEEIREENPDLNDEEIDELIENKAVEEYAKQNDKDFEEEKRNNDMMIELEDITATIKICEQQVLESDEKNQIQLQEKIDKLKTKQEQLVEKLSLSKDEKEKVDAKAEKVIEERRVNGQEKNILQENKNLNESIIEENVLEEDDELSNMFANDEIDIEEYDNISNMFDEGELEENSDISDLFISEEKELENNTQKAIPKDKQVFINPILTGVDKNDLQDIEMNGLKQEDYTMEVDENKGLWNKIKNTFAKIKDNLVQKLNLNKNKGLKGQEIIDTAENNIPSKDDKIGNTNSWELSQYGMTQEEVLQNTKNAINNSENDKSNENSNIKVSDQEVSI